MNTAPAEENTHWIAGTWCEGEGPRWTRFHPATGAASWSGAAASPGQVDAAFTAARAAAPAWARRPLAEREDILRSFAAALDRRREDLAGRIADDIGKPLWEARTEVQAMVAKIDLTIRAQAARTSPFSGGGATTRFRPHGVAAVLGPFNFPGHLPNGQIAPLLLAGNAVVFKPSEYAPRTGPAMVAAWLEAGLPPGVLQLVQGGRATGAAVADHPALNALFFTGSAATGHALHRQFAGRPDVLLALEMGGNNALVVDVEALAEDAVPGALFITLQSAFLSAGQRCTCARRLILPAGRAGDAFLERLTAAASRLVIGHPRAEPPPYCGPVVHAEAAAALLAQSGSLLGRGARVLLAPRLLAPATGLLTPAIVDVTPLAERADEEWFGPLLQVVRTDGLEAALTEADRTRYGLAAGLVSPDPQTWERFRERVQAGVLNWNAPLTGASGAAPFGGVRHSGNHRPGAWFTADSAAQPVASIEAAQPTLPSQLPPGLSL